MSANSTAWYAPKRETKSIKCETGSGSFVAVPVKLTLKLIRQATRLKCPVVRLLRSSETSPRTVRERAEDDKGHRFTRNSYELATKQSTV